MLTACLALPPAAAEVRAQSHNIATDGRFSPAQVLTGPTYTIDAGLGRQVGGNLFESFSKFGLATGEQAIFSGPSSVGNIVAGVTGGNVSHIDGTVSSTIAGANLYLINPAGVVFGPRGSVDISGSFHASTADYVKMTDGTHFDVKNPGSSTVSAAPIAAFGFLNAPVGKIKVHGASLTASPGQGLDLVGGPVSLNGAQLSAPGGTIRIAAANASGEIPVNPGQRSSAPVSTFAPVTIGNGSVVSVSDPTGSRGSGTVRVRAATLSITGSQLDADNFAQLASAGEIKLHVDGQTLLDASSSVHAKALRPAPVTGVDIVTGSLLLNHGSMIDTSSTDAGAAGSINIKTGPLTLEAGSQIKSESKAAGPAGPISIVATGDVLIDSTGGATPSTIDANSNSNQPAGSVTLSAQSLSLQGISAKGPSALTANGGIGGDAGIVTINLAGGLSLTDFAVIAADGSSVGGSGAPGLVQISATDAMIAGGAAVSARVTNGGSASGGQIDLDAANITIDGSATPGQFTGITTATSGRLASSGGGAITVNADNLSILPFGEIAAGTFGPGNGGGMSVNVRNVLLIDGTNANFPGAVTGLGVEAASSATGAGGTINVAAGSLTIRGNGQIAGGSVLNGNGGQVSVDVVGALTIDGTGVTGTGLSGVLAQGENGSGNAGNLRVSAGSLAISNGGTISVSTTGSGAGGDVTVSVQGAAVLASGGTISSQAIGSGNGGNVVLTTGGALSLSGANTGITGSATPTSTGNAGSVSVSAPQIKITDGAQIASAAAGTGAGGPVSVATPGTLLLDGAGSQIAASAIGPQAIAGGNVSITAGAVTVQNGGEITSSTAGAGRGGDIDVQTASDIVLTGAGPQITALSAGTGAAGSIAVAAQNLTMTDGASISTSAASANGGDISLTIGDFLHLVRSQITTSVIGAGNGGNIAIDPQFLVLDQSQIIAQAVQGNGGNISIVAGEYLSSADSLVSASSALGISGNIEINGPRVDLNGSLVALAADLRAAAAVLRENCGSRGSRPRSSLTEAGRGGLTPDPDGAQPSLYLAGRDVGASAHHVGTPIDGGIIAAAAAVGVLDAGCR